MKDIYQLQFLADVARNKEDVVYPYPGLANLCNGCEHQDLSLQPLPCKLTDFRSYGIDGWDFIGPDILRRANGIESCDGFTKNPKIIDLQPLEVLKPAERQKPPLGFPKPRAKN